MIIKQVAVKESQIQSEREQNQQKITNLEKYFAKHPKLVQIDPIENQKKVLDRGVFTEILKEVENRLPKETKVRMPRHIIIQNEEDMKDISHLHFPLICKTVLAAGTENSHQMGIIFNKESLKEFKPPILVQEFYNHNAVCFKVYVLGENVQIEKRKSVPNLPLNHSHTVFFDSQKPFLPQIEKAVKLTNQKSEEQNLKESIEPPMETVEQISKALRECFGLSLLSYDLITQEKTGFHAVIDVNYFPNFISMKDGHKKLFDFLISKAK